MAGQYKPKPVFQLRKDPAHKKGSALQGLNCNAASGALLVDFVTCGAKRPSGAHVRELTNDFVGGVHVGQVAVALDKGWNIDLDTNNGQFESVVKALRKGRGVSLSGSSSATVGTKFQADEDFAGNHQWALTDIRDAGGEPEILVYDPLADGRRNGIATSPMWMPVSRVKTFAGKLDMRSKQEVAAKKPKEPLGIGRAIYGVTDVVACGGTPTPKTTPTPTSTVKLRPGAVLVNGEIGREMTVIVPVARVRGGPTTEAEIVGRKHIGMKFKAFQKINGQRVAGFRTWFGGREGERWMHGMLFGPAGLSATMGPEPGNDPAVNDPDAPNDSALPDETEDVFDEDVGEVGEL